MPPKSLDSIKIKIESEAIKELQKIYERIDEKLNTFDPTEEIKKKVEKELNDMDDEIEKIGNVIKEHIESIKELLGINQYYM